MKLRLWPTLTAALFALGVLGTTPLGSAAVQQRGQYIALGDSISAGSGASAVFKRWVQLYYGYLQSNGSGVTDLLNPSLPGATSTDLNRQQLGPAVATINASSDTKAVTIDIGINDVYSDPNCPTANAPACPLGGNLRAILGAINTALANDPGAETLQVMEYYNSDRGTPNESATRQMLLGSDGTLDCSGPGAALGLNDLIHCISIEQGATPVDVLPIFDAAGQAFIAGDHIHPNDAGHLAIANAFGGAALPTAPPPPPSSPTLRASKPKLSAATPGRLFTARMRVTDTETGKGVKGQVTCQIRLSGKSLHAMSRSSSFSGSSSCSWRVPRGAHHKALRGSIKLKYQDSSVSRSFSTKIK